MPEDQRTNNVPTTDTCTLSHTLHCTVEVLYTLSSADSSGFFPRPWRLIGIGRGLAASPLPHHRTYGSRIRRFGGCSQGDTYPNRSLVSRCASGAFIPGARGLTPRRMRSHRSTSGDDSSPPFGPSAHPRCGSAYLLPRLSALGCLTSVACAGPTMPSADFCGAVREDSSALSPCQDTPQISRGKLSYRRCIDAGFIKHSPRVDGGLHGRVPARPDCATPRIRFVSLAPHLRSTLPSDPTSR